ncbi:hypothetical protein COHA_010244 [Chlorella ohadii]|uniref:DNA 3'-5' helicase n=1 Tax=Chlorella ohadii TaxID=2649997 RepID=A0AAD5DGQ0_9CHLO|nr:hypothetical protein COHA_010244 [Chlorella ohadii]
MSGGAKVRLKVGGGGNGAASGGSGGGDGGRRRRKQDDDEDYEPGVEDDGDVIVISDDEAGGDEEYVIDDEDEEDDFDVYDSEEEAEEEGAGGGRASRLSIHSAVVLPCQVGRRRSRTEFGEDEDLEEEWISDDEGEVYRLGAGDEEFRDFSSLQLKPDHYNRPLWVCPDARVFLETFSPVYKQAYDFLIAIAEPVSRPEWIHEYQLTPHSLYAAVSIGLECDTILAVLNRLSKNVLPADIRRFVRACTQNYGKVKLVLQQNRFFVESPHPDILRQLLRDTVIKDAAMKPKEGEGGAGGFRVEAARRDRAVASLAQIEEIDLAAEDDDSGAAGAAAAAAAPAQQQQQQGPGEPPAAGLQQQGQQGQGQQPAYMLDAVEEDPDRELHMFEVEPAKVEKVKERCLPDALNYPMLEEYDFKHDSHNPDLAIDLKPNVQHRPYQEKSLSKMFGNGRARSGIIVLPCGAGKSLVGVSAAARIKKSCLCLCTNGVSVDQWKYQFEMWTNIQKGQVCRFTSQTREWFESPAGVCITTYTMVAFSGRRSAEGERIMREIMSREWGLILLDEVHVVPAAMFRRVLGIVKAHCKLGLTATLVREDSLIGDLNFLIGPKLYEANWLDLTRGGHIANVQCAEVWCPMTREFAREYMRPTASQTQKQLLYVMNPAKLRACQFLVQYHEQRGDKVIVFSDNIYALRHYAVAMKKPFIYGGTGHQERTRILHAFKHNPAVNTVFLSKVGDNSLDIPEANVLIQISSHAGSRRQEAQRLGRILRKKKAKPGQAASAEEYDAFFYTLVTLDTQEVYFTAKRQQFLIDQGYSYKVIPSLLEAAGVDGPGGGGLLLGTREEQLDVLASILAASDADLAEEDETDDKDDVANLKKKAATKRVVGNMAALSGAAGISYMEYSTQQRQAFG